MIDLKETHLHISGEALGKKYDADIELFADVVVSESGWNTKGRNIIMNISKKDKEAEEYWPRITKDKVKNPHIKVDWAKWVDEEDVGKKATPGMDEDWDPESMNNFNMGGMGGDNSDDDEDEEEAEGEVKDAHQHGENCNHEEDAKADLNDLEGDA